MPTPELQEFFAKIQAGDEGAVEMMLLGCAGASAQPSTHRLIACSGSIHHRAQRAGRKPLEREAAAD
jgi:hypothetical protein